MTGIKSVSDGELVVSKIAEEVRYMLENGIPVSSVSGVQRVVSSDFVIRMINSDFSFGFSIRRKNLHRLLISPDYNNLCSFQPMGYPGVKLQYFWNKNRPQKDGVCRCSSMCFGKGSGAGDGQCKKVTVAVFESGNVLITGGNNFDQIDEAYAYITRVVLDNKEEVEKPLITGTQAVKV